MRGHWLTMDRLSSRKLSCNYAIELLRGTLQADENWLIVTKAIYKNTLIYDNREGMLKLPKVCLLKQESMKRPVSFHRRPGQPQMCKCQWA